jgi:hypothetical protein
MKIFFKRVSGSVIVPAGSSVIPALNALAASATDDCAKPLIASTLQAVESAQNGSTVTIYTDSYADDLNLSNQLLTLAVNKGVKVR